MLTRKRIPRADLVEMLQGMAMLVDWHGQLVEAALQMLGEESEGKGRGTSGPQVKRGAKYPLRLRPS